MPKIEPFERYADYYEQWFERNKNLFLSELKLLSSLLEDANKESSLEVGVGSGIFAHPLGIKIGVDPSMEMLKRALKRGIKVVRGVAEKLPFHAKVFQTVLMVTTICFVDDPILSFKEIERVLKTNGTLVVGFVDKESFLGKLYEAKKTHSKFYGPATFYSTEEIIRLVENHTNLKLVEVKQTLFGKENIFYPTEEGYGKGAFVGLKFKLP
ncbi:MAG: class I SAM-dependent methyltransferase [Aquificae bacterium]|nr:class I SAM-dependent methyltransferase [Aquificota bacterium]